MKKLLAFVLAGILCLGIAGCGSKDSGWSYIEDKGVLTVGLDDTFAPMGFRDEAGTLVGFDIDLAMAVGEYLGVEIQFQPIAWAEKEMDLESKRIDCIWNGMSATPARQESMSLTDKYLRNAIIIMAIDPGVTVNSAADLANYSIGTQEQSAALETMQDHDDFALFGENIVEYGDYDQVIMAMQGGRIDCMVVDRVLGDYKNTMFAGEMKTCAFDFGDDYFAIGCRLGEDDVSGKLNEAIGALIGDGTAGKISEKWFGANIIILEGY